MDDDNKLECDALLYIKQNSKAIIHRYCGTCVPVQTPVSLFMAGSPGAGKTEVSKSLMKRFETVPVRIDADEIRAMCPGYVGEKSHIFQKAATKGVHLLHDYALDKQLHLILDGTFAYGESLKNIERSINRKRQVELWFVYQDPLKAWEFTKAREALEARHVSKEVFIKSFFQAKINTINAKNLFGTSLVLNLLIKNIDNSDGKLQLNVQGHELDPYIGTSYTEDDLNRLLT